MKIAILGYGKMGKIIEKIAIERGHKIILKTNSKTKLKVEHLKDVDVAIEFSTPNNALNNIKTCFNANKPIVIGTTGWYSNFDEIKNICINENKTMLYSTNFSIGVNLFFEINKKIAKLMNPHIKYDVNIEEIHHIEKLDSPSGTAITLAEQIINNNERKNSWTNNNNTKNNTELIINSKREGKVPGTHIVKYTSDIDNIEIKHTANNREGFALGAVLASEFVLNKKGVLTMKDVLF